MSAGTMITRLFDAILQLITRYPATVALLLDLVRKASASPDPVAAIQRAALAASAKAGAKAAADKALRAKTGKR